MMQNLNSILAFTFIFYVSFLFYHLIFLIIDYILSNRLFFTFVTAPMSFFVLLLLACSLFVILVFHFIICIAFFLITHFVFRMFHLNDAKSIIFYEEYLTRILNPQFHDFLIIFLISNLLFLKVQPNFVDLIMGNFNDDSFY